MARDRETSPTSDERRTSEGMPGNAARASWRPPSWSRSPLLHEWIRSGSILIAAGWGVYTFVWKDILVPAWQPAHLSLEASLTPVSDRPATAEGREMTLVVKAINPSSRPVYPLANIWWLRGIHRESRPTSEVQSERPFLQESDQALRREALQHIERTVLSTSGELLAVGRLFDDDVVDPGGTVNRTILVRIPNSINAVDLRVVVPLLTRPPKGLFVKQRLAWGLSNTGDPIPLICPTIRSMGGQPTMKCQPADAEIDKKMQEFDPRKATITLNLEIGLPKAADGTSALNSYKP